MSAHLPYFKFYPSDFMGSGKVQAMSPAERGIYIAILCHEWQEGPLRDDPKRLARVANATPDEMDDCWPAVRECFEVDGDGRLYHPRLEKERSDALHRRKMAKKAARVSAEVRKADAQADASTDAQADARASGGADAEPPRAGTHSLIDSESHDSTETPMGDKPPEYPAPAKLERKGREYEYPEPFERVWSAYPSRDGNNPKKGAYRQWRARVRAGADPDDLAEAVTAYAKHITAKGIEGERMVMMAQTFFGPDEPWMQDWSKNGTKSSASSGTKARHERGQIFPEERMNA